MATLYELDQSVKSCIRYNDKQVVNTETGEILDIEALEALNLERDVKREQVALYIKNRLADYEMCKAEADKMLKRAKAYENETQRLKDYLAESLQGEKLKTAKVAISWRNVKSVEVINSDLIPDRYMRFKCEPNKQLLKQELEAGVEIEGASLVTKLSMSIK